MAEVIRLAAIPRTQTKARALRREGQVPGVFYGQGQAAQPLQCDSAALERAIALAGTNQLVMLDIQGEVKVGLVRDVQRHPVTGRATHFDLYRVVADHTLTSTVPIVLVGHSPALEAGGIVNHLLEELEIECLPADLPADIVVDLAALKEIGAFVAVADLPVPQGVTVLTPAETEVVRIVVGHTGRGEDEAAAPKDGAASA